MTGVGQGLFKSKMLTAEGEWSGERETCLYSSCLAMPCQVAVWARALQLLGMTENKNLLFSIFLTRGLDKMTSFH